jgi:AcrR family transcriptional regulator
MPPKAEITKEKILNAAFEIAREQGFDALTARSVAQRLNCSTQPIYSVYGSMDKVKDDVYDKAVEFAVSCMKNYPNHNDKPAQNIGRGYLYFARNEKQLFRTVYLSGHKKYDIHKEKFIGEELTTLYMRYSNRLNSIEEIKLKKIFQRLSIYLIGIGTMLNTGTLDLSMEEAIEMVSEMYESLLLSEGITRH